MSRSLTAELSPPILREGGFFRALEWLSGWMRDRYGLTVNLISRGPIEAPPEEVCVFLFHAVRELLFNVVKHSGVKAASIESELQDGQIRIAVSDQGNGFDTTSLRAAGGAAGGFGLFSLEERLSHLRGRMEITSAPGRGCRIALFAPLSSHDVPMPPPSAKKKEAALAVGLPGPSGIRPEEGGIRVMLVDDHIIVRRGLASLLGEQSDINVAGEASDGLSALDMVRRIQPDVVIMDIGLPDLNGIEVTRIIHKEFPNINIICLSMYEDKEQSDAMRQAGAVDYITKGGPSDAIIAAIRTCMRL